jgi:hypothetical protein
MIITIINGESCGSLSVPFLRGARHCLLTTKTTSKMDITKCTTGKTVFCMHEGPDDALI